MLRPLLEDLLKIRSTLHEALVIAAAHAPQMGSIDYSRIVDQIRECDQWIAKVEAMLEEELQRRRLMH